MRKVKHLGFTHGKARTDTDFWTHWPCIVKLRSGSIAMIKLTLNVRAITRTLLSTKQRNGKTLSTSCLSCLPSSVFDSADLTAHVVIEEQSQRTPTIMMSRSIMLSTTIMPIYGQLSYSAG
jgi:hypothetical protein